VLVIGRRPADTGCDPGAKLERCPWLHAGYSFVAPRQFTRVRVRSKSA